MLHADSDADWQSTIEETTWDDRPWWLAYGPLWSPWIDDKMRAYVQSVIGNEENCRFSRAKIALLAWTWHRPNMHEWRSIIKKLIEEIWKTEGVSESAVAWRLSEIVLDDDSEIDLRRAAYRALCAFAGWHEKERLLHTLREPGFPYIYEQVDWQYVRSWQRGAASIFLNGVLAVMDHRADVSKRQTCDGK